MSETDSAFADYRYTHGRPTWDDQPVWSVVRSELARVAAGSHVFELGCGNGALSARVAALGFEVTAVDPSVSGIDVARRCHPGIRFEVGSVAEPLAARFGSFPVVLSVEVIEHCFSPTQFATELCGLLAPGGIAIVSTPYHGYLKNLALALTGRFDTHFTALWEGGHIKFFSIKTLTELFTRHGLRDIQITRVGRIPPFAKSMVLVARKP